MLNRFTADYLETLAQADFAPRATVAGRLASYDGLLMEAVGLSLPVGTVCAIGDKAEERVHLSSRPRLGSRQILIQLGFEVPNQLAS